MYRSLFFRLFLSLSLAVVFLQNSFAVDRDIATGLTVNTTLPINNGDSVSFIGTSGGILNSNHTGSLTILSLLNESSNGTSPMGTLDFSTNGDLEVTGKIGTTTSLLDVIELTTDAILTANDEINVANGITTDSNGQGALKVDGTFLVNAKVGASSLVLNNINVSQDGSTVTFNDDIYSNLTVVSSGATMHVLDSGSNTVVLGNVDLKSSASLILDTNAAVNDATVSVTNAYTSTATSTLTIAADKRLTVSGVDPSIIDGTVNLGITYDGGNPSSTTKASFVSSSAVTVTDGTKFHFNYTDASELKEGITHTFLSTTGTLTATDSTFVITDNSALLKPTVAKASDTLVLTNAIDSDVTAKLGVEENGHITRLLADELGTLMRVELLKIPDFDTLEGSLDSLEEERNNMVQMASLDAANRVQNVINYRMMALNYNYIGFSSGNKGPERGSIWGETYGGYASQGERLNEDGYKAIVGGLIFGGDGVMRSSSTDFRFGLALSYANTNIKGDSLASQDTDINSYQVSLYNNIVASNGLGFFSESSATAGYNQYESIRKITVGAANEIANADYNGTQFSLGTGVGYNFKVDNKLLVSPNVSVRYSSLTLDDYTETNAPTYGLDVKNEVYDTLVADLGIRVMGELDVGGRDYSVFPQLNLSWSRNLDTDGREVETSFISSSATKTKNVGIDLVENMFNAGLQFNIERDDAASFILKYEFQGAKDYMSHLASVRYRLAF